MTLQEQYNLIKNGKGHKGVFLTEAKKQFPSMLTNPMGFEEASKILKTRGVISENYIDLKPINTIEASPKAAWETKFAKFLAEEAKKKKIVNAKQNGDKSYTVTYEDDTTAKIAVSNDDWDKIHSKYGRLTEAEEAKVEEKKVTKEVEETQSHNFDYKDKTNLDNQIGQEVLNGIYFEGRENPDKTLDELRKIVAKNLAKDGQYYMKNAAFGIKGLGYKETEVEEVAGKYASSGYSDKLKKLVKESLVKEASEPVQLNVVFNNTEDYIRAKQWFSEESDFYASSEHDEFQTLSFEVADQDDADATERAIDQELQGSEIQSWRFELMEGVVTEMDVNDPVIMSLRAAKDRRNQYRKDAEKLHYTHSKNIEQKLQSLERARQQVLSDMEQEAEPEGGPIADLYGDKLNKIDQAIARLKGRGKEKDVELSYDEVIGRAAMIQEEVDEELLDVAQTAMRISKEEGVVQHVNELPGGGYTISDFYDSDSTVISFEDGRKLNESSEFKIEPQPEKKKVKKESLDSDLAEIDTQAGIVAMEAKLDKISEIISTKMERLNMIEEDTNLAELIDKGKMKAMQKEIKILEKRKAKMEKIYEKMTGKSYTKEMVDESAIDNE